MRTSAPRASLLWTGEDPLNADLRTVGTGEARTADMRVVPVTLALLFLTFGGLIAAGLPVLSGVITLPMALGIAVLLTAITPVSVLLVNVVTMIGLGLSIDYALLMVSRFRETMRAGVAPHEAARLQARAPQDGGDLGHRGLRRLRRAPDHADHRLPRLRWVGCSPRSSRCWSRPPWCRRCWPCSAAGSTPSTCRS